MKCSPDRGDPRSAELLNTAGKETQTQQRRRRPRYLSKRSFTLHPPGASAHRVFDQDAECICRNLRLSRSLPLRDGSAKLVPKGGQLTKLTLDIAQVPLGKLEHAAARTLSSFTQPKDFPDFLKCETKRLGLPNKLQSLQIRVTVDAVAGILARWVGQQTATLIEAYGLN